MLESAPIKIQQRFREGISDNDRKKLSSLMLEDGSALFYMPIFLDDDKGLTLVARHWSFVSYLSREVYKFPALVIFDERLLPQLEVTDDQEISRLLNMELHLWHEVATKGRTTEGREKCRTTGRICPFCNGVLRMPRSKKDRARENGHVVTCENNVKKKESKYHAQKCDFEMILTAYEFEKFQKYDLDITTILQATNERCPKCNSNSNSQNNLYRRTILKGISDVSVLKRCRDGYSSTNKCFYARKLS